jgi:hypothetical protein
MDHGKSCRCVACEMVRVWMHGQATGGPGGHPVCCACPLCAEPRQNMRRAEYHVETSTFDKMYQREVNRAAAINSWWLDQQTTTQPLYPTRNYSASIEMNDAQRAEIDWDQEMSDRASDEIDAFDLLHDLGILIRTDEP